MIFKYVTSALLLLFLTSCNDTKMAQIQKFESGNLSGINLFCKERDLLVTYSFLNNNRYKATNYFLVYFDIGERMGTYGLTSNHRYFYLKADKKLTIYNKLSKNDKKEKWKKKIVDSPKLDYYFDRKDLNIISAPSKLSQIKNTCKLFKGTIDELNKMTLKKYQNLVSKE